MRPEYRGSAGDSSDDVEDRFAAVVYPGEEHEGRRNTCRIALPAEAWRQSEIAPM